MKLSLQSGPLEVHSMSPQLAMSFSHYMRTYQRYAYDFWENLSPSQYGMVLVAVFIAGYLMMKSAR